MQGVVVCNGGRSKEVLDVKDIHNHKVALYVSGLSSLCRRYKVRHRLTAWHNHYLNCVMLAFHVGHVSAYAAMAPFLRLQQATPALQD